MYVLKPFLFSYYTTIYLNNVLLCLIQSEEIKDVFQTNASIVLAVLCTTADSRCCSLQFWKGDMGNSFLKQLFMIYYIYNLSCFLPQRSPVFFCKAWSSTLRTNTNAKIYITEMSNGDNWKNLWLHSHMLQQGWNIPEATRQETATSRASF